MSVKRGLAVKKLKIKQIRSYIGRPEKHRRVLRGLGLGKLNRTVLLNDTPEIRGMAQKVIHLVAMEEVEGNEI
ncbi:MAG: 50S ribosomal protein L30 [Deltaproteobacteria bacterium]|nr:50S ribosomal protein L30 [Deltaproteobacteria bacterium]